MPGPCAPKRSQNVLREFFYLTDRESAVKFLRESGLRALESEGWLPAGAFSPNAPALHIVIDGPPSPLFSDHGTDDTLEQDGNLKASFYWSSMSRAQSVEMGTFYYDPTPSLSSHQNAVRRLVEVAGNAGIARLVVPLPLWNSSFALLQIAENVDVQSQRLRLVTGWKGGVMGLRGRADWFMRSSDLSGSMYRQSDGTALVVGPPEIALHEWAHALDNLVAVHARFPVDPSVRHSILATYHVRNSEVHHRAWYFAYSRLINRVQAIPLKPGQKERYWRMVGERLAYLFDSYATDRAQAAGIIPSDPYWVSDPTENGPSFEKARESTVGWTRLFKVLEPLYEGRADSVDEERVAQSN